MEYNITPFESRDKILLAYELFGVPDPDPAYFEYRRRLRNEVGIPVPPLEEITYRVRRG